MCTQKKTFKKIHLRFFCSTTSRKLEKKVDFHTAEVEGCELLVSVGGSVRDDSRTPNVAQGKN